ncbi:hypothetical protein FKO01_32510 [Mesorhizobium sp. B2-3-3]|nr:hypothetical protein FKO01_32510 [Mesorhizobium sp. B2-3-3]
MMPKSVKRFSDDIMLYPALDSDRLSRSVFATQALSIGSIYLAISSREDTSSSRSSFDSTSESKRFMLRSPSMAR